MANPKPVDTRYWQKQEQGVKIEQFLATAVKIQGVFDPANPTKQLIHWRGGGAYKLKGADRSTSFDTCKLNKTDSDIEVQFISKPFAVSSAAPYHWECKLAKEYTTTDVYDLLVTKKFNQYRYNGSGSGCKTWTIALVELPEKEEVLPSGAKQSFLAKVAEVRSIGCRMSLVLSFIESSH